MIQTLSPSAFANRGGTIAGDGARGALLAGRGAHRLADLFGNADHGLHMAALAVSWTTR